MRIIKTIDCHVGGHLVRLVVDGVPRALGSDASTRASWFEDHHDDLRRALVLEPRGHQDLTAVALTEASSAGAHAGLLFMDGGGYPSVVPTAMMAAAVVCVERRLITTRHADRAGGAEGHRARPDSTDQDTAAGETLVFETALGPARARARVGTPTADAPDQVRVSEVALDLGPAFVHTAAGVVHRGSRRVPVDIAFGGGFYAIVDSEAAGVPLDRAHTEDLRRVGMELCADVARRWTLGHPQFDDPHQLGGVVFTGAASGEPAHLRGAVVSPHGVVDRSSVSGVPGLMAVLDAMGLVLDGQPFVQEGLAGLPVRGRLLDRTPVGDLPAVRVEVSAAAWIVGEHTWVLHDDDPLRYGPPDNAFGPPL